MYDLVAITQVALSSHSSPCITCVQYHGGVQYRGGVLRCMWGDILSTVGDVQ